MMDLRHHPDGCIYPELRATHWEWTTHPPDEAFALYVHDVPISIARIFHRRLVGSALAFNVAGIGGVWTAPSHRYQHHASRVLGFALRGLARRSTMVAAVLFATPEKGRLYERQHFVRVQPYLYVRSLIPGVTFEEETPQVPVPRWRVEPEGRF